MRRKLWIYSGFFLLLVIGFYFTMTKLLPGFGKVKLPVLNYVQPFQFTNQDGKLISEKEVQGKVYIAEYFFTSCPSICPIMNNNMKKVYEAYKDQPDFLILSHTSDPGNDNAKRLRWYADSLQVDTRHWWFLTGRKDSLYNAARQSYLLDDPKNNLRNIEDQFMHTQFVALVDKTGRVRKIYDGLKKEELKELTNDIQGLLKEPASPAPYVKNVLNN